MNRALTKKAVGEALDGASISGRECRLAAMLFHSRRTYPVSCEDGCFTFPLNEENEWPSIGVYPGDAYIMRTPDDPRINSGKSWDSVWALNWNGGLIGFLLESGVRRPHFADNVAAILAAIGNGEDYSLQSAAKALQNL